MSTSPVSMQIPSRWCRSRGNSDLCFAWPGSIEDAIAHLTAQEVVPEKGPVTRHGGQGAGKSVYFRDPDGSLMEFFAYTEQRL